jgi:hypothetical protein
MKLGINIEVYLLKVKVNHSALAMVLLIRAGMPDPLTKMNEGLSRG